MRTMNKILSSQSFYDEISKDYNSFMGTLSNHEVRDKVALVFTSSVQEGLIMDFGGGTGADLPWLLKSRYKIFFCEPSEGMRLKAVEWVANQRHEERVIFMSNGTTDFQQWTLNNLPVQEKMDAVLANFAVLNCIELIETLFEKISLIIKPHGCFFCTVIDTRFQTTIKKHPKQTILNLVQGRTMTTNNKYLSMSHKVYLHTVNEIKRKSSAYFSIDDVIALGGYGFLLLKLKSIV